MTLHLCRTLLAVTLGGILFSASSDQAPKSDPKVATIDKPAVFSVRAPSAGVIGPFSAIVSVIGYRPAKAGTVAAVVTVGNDRLAQKHELGRFGVFPDISFSVAIEDARRFGFGLSNNDLELLKQSGSAIIVAIEPSGGTGQAAQIVIDRVEVIKTPGSNR